MSQKLFKLNQMEIFCKNNCKMKNPQRVEEIVNKIINSGLNKLQLVTDFDATLTKQHQDGVKILSSFCILEKCKSMPQEYLDETLRLFKIYKPIEVDPNIPINEKEEKMIIWWNLSNNLLKQFPTYQSEIDEVAFQFKDCLRDGTSILFNNLHQHNVPILVFSAGIGNSVEAILKHAKLLLPNVKIVSNFLIKKDGELRGFDESKFIHIFNKNETVLKNTDYYDLVADRHNIIVMGDSIGDSHMSNGASADSNILKIGFLYENIDGNLPHYMDAFDIVLIDDQTMDVPTTIIDMIISNAASK